jgi:hypothetical protein
LCVEKELWITKYLREWMTVINISLYVAQGVNADYWCSPLYTFEHGNSHKLTTGVVICISLYTGPDKD